MRPKTDQTASRRSFLALASASLIAPVPSVFGQSVASSSRGDLYTPANDEKMLVLGGDYFLDHRLSTKNPSQEVFDVFRNASFSFANLEGGLSTKGSAALGGFTHGPSLRGEPEFVSELPWAGVRSVSVSNNHVGNFGREALLETLETLDKAGIAHSGAGKNIEAAYEASYSTVAGMKVGFCSFYSYLADYGANDVATNDMAGIAVARAYEVLLQPSAAFDTTNRDILPYVIETKIPPTYRTLAPGYRDLALMKDAVRKAASNADFVFVSIHFHWALHGNSYLPPLQRVIAQEMIDAGADLLIGHGPHTIRAVELYKGKPIFYSAGNLVLRDERDRAILSDVEKALPVDAIHQAFIVRVAIARHALRSVEILPISLRADGCPVFASPNQGAATINKLIGLSASLDTTIHSKDWFGIVEL